MPEQITNARPFVPPFFTFRFDVEFTRDAIDGQGGGRTQGREDICKGSFSEISGLEASMEAKVIREGGWNYGAHQRSGPVTFATVVMKRGITDSRDLWKWWALFAGARDPSLVGQPAGGAFAHRMTVRITLQDLDHTPRLRWRLERAMPVKFKAAEFSARAADVGIEELHLAHEGLFFEAV